MANKALVIDINGRTELNGVLDRWEAIGNMQAFTRDIITPKLDENADKSAIVSGIPTVYARANMFSLALSYSGDSMSNTSAGMIAYYNELIDEWKGLITCIALDSGKLQIKRVELGYSDGKPIEETGNLYEPKGAFGNMLFERAPLWTELVDDNLVRKPFINIIKYNNQVVGGTSPESLLFTAPSYSIPANENYAPDGKFRDPIKYGRNLDETKWLALYAYVKNLIERLKNEFTAYYQCLKDKKETESLCPTYDHITNRLEMWLEEIKGKIKDDVEKAAANPVTGFTSPFSILFNYSDSMYGANGILITHPEVGYTEFKAEDLLLPRGSEIARVILNTHAKENYTELPVQLLEASLRGSESGEKAYFALPLSVIGLKIFGSSVAALVGQQDNVVIRSRMSAEYSPEDRENNLIVRLTLNTEDGKTKNVVVVYSVKSDKCIKDSDILLWPNFISNQWNKYYMYSEMPAGVSSIDYNAVPFVGEQVDGKFLPIMDENYSPVYLTEDTRELSKRQINSMLLVTADHRVAESPYKYEIYQSNKPFGGVKLTCGTDREGKEKMAGFLLIRYAPEGSGKGFLPENMMERRVVYKSKGVHLGFDFGSTNSSVAYYDPNDDDDLHAKGLEFKNRRVSLFGNDNMDGKHQPKDFFFFSKQPTQSNALKSVLTLHDQRRMPNGNDTFKELPVAGGLPCFMSNLPLKAVSANTISLDFGNGVEATLINSMKWSESPVDKAYKTAYLRTLLLMVYAELFKKGLKPEKLNWSYPSTMERSTILTHYNPIWKSLGSDNVSPILEYEGGSVIPLEVTDISGQNNGNNMGGGLNLGGSILGGNEQTTAGFGFGMDLGLGQSGDSMMGNSGLGSMDWINGGGQKEVTEEKSINLEPDDPNKKLEFHPINTEFPMTEACASANFTAQTAAVRKKVVYCFDVGGSTTDISALFSLMNGDPYMIKQNSIRFAAQKISQAIRKMPDEFKEVLTRVCDTYNIKLIGFNRGVSRYSAETAPYYYEQIVDILDADQLKYFYSCIAERCPRLFAVNMYVTGLIMYYAGQLFLPLVKAINANRGAGSADIEGIEPVFEGKGARIFDWLCTKDMNMAENYFKAMFKAGAQSPKLPNERIDLNKLRSGRANDDVKFEVSKGLASENGSLMEPTDSFEIFGENGFRGFSPEGKVYEYAFDTRLTSDWMREIGGYIRQPKANCECFTQFLSIYGGAVQQILGIVMDVNEMRQGLDHMEIEQYITQEVPRFKEAMARSRNNQKFDYVAPIIIIEGLKFYDKHLLKCFKK